MRTFISYVRSFWNEEDAPTMAEYGLLLALIAVVVIAAAAFLGTEVSSIMHESGTAIDNATP